MAACSSQSQLDEAQTEEPPPVKSKKKPATPRDAGASDAERDASDVDAETRISTRESDSERDAGSDASEPEPPKKPAKTERDAGQPKTPEEEPSPKDAGEEAPEETSEEDKPAEVCSRVWLREHADAYVQSMASGDTMPLSFHASFRYTENGRDAQLGTGAWLRRGEIMFSRHVLDESRCSTLTQAVMSGLTGRSSFGVRLRYSEGQLLEAEAQLAPELLAASDLDTIIPMGDDVFIAEVPERERMSREALFDFAQRYFDSVIAGAEVPPSAPDCRRLQNGAPLGNGTCTEAPGTARFEQQRFDVADELSGIVTATVLYNNHIGFYMIKIAGDRMQNIHVIGGASSQATGW